MVGVGEIKILHGKGNGILREELRKYLKTMGGVASFRDEQLQMGGSGITVVTLDN
jgi:DNA mismatch repair protein MutS2